MHVWLSDIWAHDRVKRGLFGSRCAWSMAPSRGERDPTNLAPDWLVRSVISWALSIGTVSSYELCNLTVGGGWVF